MIKELSEPNATTPASTNYSSLKLYLHEIKPWSRPTPAEEKRLLASYHHGNDQARNTLILSHLKWVVAIAQTFKSHSTHLLELIAEGNLALIHSIESFQAKSNARLATYAYPRVRGAMIQAIHRINRIVRVPDYQLRKHRSSQTCLTHPQPAENETLQNIIEDQRAPLPIDSLPIQPANSSPNHTPPELDYYLHQLTPQEQRLLHLRYGLQGHKPHTLAAIGKMSGITHEAVRQKLAKTLQQLRELPR